MFSNLKVIGKVCVYLDVLKCYFYIYCIYIQRVLGEVFVLLYE